MIEQRELITISRQIGSMMEAGVDILRITRVLRAQVDNPEILRGFDTLDHDLRMGQGLSDAMENVPAMFSPFAISLVRQGEARNDLAGAFHKIAEFLQKEEEVSFAHHGGSESGAHAALGARENPFAVAPSSAVLPIGVIDDLVNRVQVAALRLFTLVAGLLLTLAAVWASVESGLVERRWQNVVLCSVASLFIGGAGVWLRLHMEKDRKKEVARREALEQQAARFFDEPSASDKPESSAKPRRAVDKPPKTDNTLEKVSSKTTSTREATFE